MKKNIITSSITVIFGLLITFGPSFLFKICSAAGCCTTTNCSLSLNVINGLGLMIAAIGLCMILYNDNKTHLGLTISVMAAAAVILLIIYVLVGGCNNPGMACRMVTFPAWTIICSVLLAGCAVNLFLLRKQSR